MMLMNYVAILLLQLYIVQTSPPKLRPLNDIRKPRKNILREGSEATDATSLTNTKETVLETPKAETTQAVTKATEEVTYEPTYSEDQATYEQTFATVTTKVTTDPLYEELETTTTQKIVKGIDSLESLESFEVPTTCVPLNGYLTTCHILRLEDLQKKKMARTDTTIAGTRSTMGIFDIGKVPATPTNLPEQYRCSAFSFCRVWQWDPVVRNLGKRI